MKKQKQDQPILRQKAEKLLEKKLFENGSSISEYESRRLVHELQVHQIELELQNEEFKQAKEEAEMASQKYSELYDFAPTSYFTLSEEGKIIELNLSGAKMLGKNQSVLLNSFFDSFVSDNTKSTFNLFLRRIFCNKSKEICEVTLFADNQLPVFVFLTGNVTKNGEKW